MDRCHPLTWEYVYKRICSFAVFYCGTFYYHVLSQTYVVIMLCVSDMAVRVIGTERHKSGITLLFELLQQPRLNKQVDILIGAPTFCLSG